MQQCVQVRKQKPSHRPALGVSSLSWWLPQRRLKEGNSCEKSRLRVTHAMSALVSDETPQEADTLKSLTDCIPTHLMPFPRKFAQLPIPRDTHIFEHFPERC